MNPVSYPFAHRHIFRHDAVSPLCCHLIRRLRTVQDCASELFVDCMEHVRDLCRRLTCLLLEAMPHSGTLTHAPRTTNLPASA